MTANIVVERNGTHRHSRPGGTKRSQLFITAYHETWGEIGYLVIDSLIQDAAIGGIRYAAGVSINEVAGLAEAMTLKCGFLNVPIGGAKAGIPVRAGLTPAERDTLLRDFGRCLGPLLRQDIYIAGQDIGISVNDLNIIRAGADLPPVTDAYDGGLYTAMTVVEAIDATLAHQHSTIAGTRFAIEGLGSVGARIAELLVARGGVVIAVSTMEGAIYHTAGLDVTQLLKLRRQYGDKAINFYTDAEPIELGKLLALDVDVLVPCARPHTIHSGNVNRIQASAVVPASNNPVAPDAERMLMERGVCVFPDFVANAGSVLAGMLVTQGFDDDEIRDIIHTEFAERTRRLLAQSGSLTSPREIAQDIAHRNIQRMTQDTGNGINRLWRLASKVRHGGPSAMIERAASGLYKRRWNRSQRVREMARRRIHDVLMAEGRDQ